WSFDTMKRYTPLETLEPEGANLNDKTKGKGLYKFTEEENIKLIDDAKAKLEQYKKDTEEKIRNASPANPPVLDDPPTIKDAVKIPSDLSPYVTFLHPWMHEILNQFVLMIMFYMLIIVTLIVLRFQDIG
ncbi:MAG TPA: hypothetical protein PKY82_35285, partial [Pyrinomonadaceae bacterium]|nr:hypothetical protein [Pyrinomonadaceae bacterium]